jgi:hypothetical protein
MERKSLILYVFKKIELMRQKLSINTGGTFHGEAKGAI